VFRLSDVSGRTVVSVWIVIAAYMVSLLVLSAVHNHERDKILNRQLAWLADTTPSSQLTPAQRAQRDSFVDSLKQLAARYGEAVKSSGQDVYVVGRALPVPPVLVLGFGVFLGPALVAAALTVVWFRSRGPKGREAGA
jgi:Flp pilus assembly protein TadB